jgi:hypothetical protein
MPKKIWAPRAAYHAERKESSDEPTPALDPDEMRAKFAREPFRSATSSSGTRDQLERWPSWPRRSRRTSSSTTWERCPRWPTQRRFRRPISRPVRSSRDRDERLLDRHPDPRLAPLRVLPRRLIGEVRPLLLPTRGRSAHRRGLPAQRAPQGHSTHVDASRASCSSSRATRRSAGQFADPRPRGRDRGRHAGGHRNLTQMPEEMTPFHLDPGTACTCRVPTRTWSRTATLSRCRSTSLSEATIRHRPSTHERAPAQLGLRPALPGCSARRPAQGAAGQDRVDAAPKR